MKEHGNGRPNGSIDPGHAAKRGILKGVGFLLVSVGGLLMLVGLVDFFSAFNSMRAPSLFWCLFLGLPMLGFGSQMLVFAFKGKIFRYVAQETAPVAKDTFNYMADGTQEGVRTVASALAGGFRDGFQGTDAQSDRRICPACETANDADSRFCDQCGATLPQNQTCPGCGERNDADARFCDGCGRKLF